MSLRRSHVIVVVVIVVVVIVVVVIVVVVIVVVIVVIVVVDVVTVVANVTRFSLNLLFLKFELKWLNDSMIQSYELLSFKNNTVASSPGSYWFTQLPHFLDVVVELSYICCFS